MSMSDYVRSLREEVGNALSGNRCRDPRSTVDQLHPTSRIRSLRVSCMWRRYTRICVAVLTSTWALVAATAPFAYVVGSAGSDGTIQVINGEVTVVDVATQRKVGAPIVVGPLPRAIAATRTTDKVYVVNQHNFGRGSVSVISATSAGVVATIAVGEEPHAIVLSPDDKTGYVLNGRSSTLSVIDLVRDQVAREIALSGVHSGLTLSPDGRWLYLPSGGSIDAIDTVTFESRRLAYAGNAANAVASPDGALLYVVETDPGAGPFGQIITPGDSVGVFDVVSQTIIKRIQVGSKPFAIAISPDGQFIYVANREDDSISIISTSTYAESRYRTGRRPSSLSVTPDGQLLFVATWSSGGELWVMHLAYRSTFGFVKAISFPASISAHMRGPAPAQGNTAPVVEFYNSGLDHYFVSQDANEIFDLDHGARVGWKRTGQSFVAYRPGQSPVAIDAVCRYYGLPSAGLDSHFYSGSEAECSAVGTGFAHSWFKETDNAFEVVLPDVVTGRCPFGLMPVYRLWNARTDSNHRYTTSLTTRNEMMGEGFVSEGYGPEGVAMCSVAFSPAVQ
jgi:YVTN family beta-propeller protein